MNAQAILVGHLGRSDLDKVEIDWPASPSDLRARRLPPKEPKGHWAYQGEAMNKVVKGFRQADRGKLIMACGTGKTLTALFIREKLAAERTLVLMSSLQLMKQTIGEWTRNKKVDFDFLPVCSDETVSKDDDDMPVSSTSDLGFPVTTDPEEIATFLRRRSGPRVVFATYQSSPAIAKAFKMSRVPAFDLAIADEAHRCAAPHSSEFATILDNEKIKAHRRLFMTATPRIYSARVLTTAKEAGFEFASMDDEEKFGKVFHRLSFREAIERDLLTDYQVVIIGVDNATYRHWAEKGWFITIDGKEVKDARAVAGQIGLAKAMRRYDLRRVITFHRLRKDANKFHNSLPEVIDWMPTRQRPKGRLWTDYVDGTMPADDRQRRLKSLSEVGEGERAVISNARCLNEGIDVPTLDGVAFIDPKRSEIDIAQAVGRAIRLADGKTNGTIVIPVFIDTDEPNPDVILDDSAFKPVWDVLLALRSHDEELAQQLDDLRRMLGRLRRGSRGPLRLPDKIRTDIPDLCGVDFARAFDVRLVEQTTASWEFWFGLLERYIAENGDPLVPVRHKTVEGAPLGSWVARQRQWFEKGILSAERIKRLGNLKGWVWDINEADWEKSFSNYLRYIEEGGYPSYSLPKDFNGFGARKFVSKQREQFKEGILSAERIKKLNAVDGWTWTAKGGAWNRGLSHYLRYVEEGGDPSSCGDKRVNGFPVGSWVKNQRAVRDQLTAEQVKRLEAVDGWVWKVHDTAWERNFSNYLRYIANGGDPTCCDLNVEFDGFRIGQWVSTQRQSFSKGTISAERIKKLSNVDGWLWKTPDAWESAFNSYLLFVKESDDPALVKQSVPMTKVMFNGSPVGSWVNTQRTAYANNNLSAERIELLESVDGWLWAIHDAAWEGAFNNYLLFVKESDDPALVKQSVPMRDVKFNGFRLGPWVNAQRTAYAKNKLSAERLKSLESVDGWVWRLRKSKELKRAGSDPRTTSADKHPPIAEIR